MSYEEKFADFIEHCAEQPKGTLVIIHNPSAIGDNYAEIVESLNRLADAELPLLIVPRSERGKPEDVHRWN